MKRNWLDAINLRDSEALLPSADRFPLSALNLLELTNELRSNEQVRFLWLVDVTRRVLVTEVARSRGRMRSRVLEALDGGIILKADRGDSRGKHYLWSVLRCFHDVSSVSG
jgi:hypothetical protein